MKFVCIPVLIVVGQITLVPVVKLLQIEKRIVNVVMGIMMMILSAKTVHKSVEIVISIKFVLLVVV